MVLPDEAAFVPLRHHRAGMCPLYAGLCDHFPAAVAAVSFPFGSAAAACRVGAELTGSAAA